MAQVEVSPRDIEKLQAIGYERSDVADETGRYVAFGDTIVTSLFEESDESAWAAAKKHAQSPDGLKATMADKVRWLKDVRIYYADTPTSTQWHAYVEGDGYGLNPRGGAHGNSPKAAVDALFWKVP